MKIIKANITHADMIGEIHTKAWMQTYKNLFPTEYLSQESKEKRVEEFRNNRQENVEYYLLMEKDIGISDYIVKPIRRDELKKCVKKSCIKIREDFNKKEQDKLLQLKLDNICSDFIKSMKAKNKEAILEKINEMFQELYKWDTVEMSIARANCIQCVVNMMRIVCDSGLEIEEIFYTKKISYKHILKLDSLDELKNYLLNFSMYVLENIKTRDIHTDNNIILQVCEYLKDNFSNSEITLKSIADRFYVNKSFLCRLFKQETGVNFVQYLMRLRIEKSIILLQSGEYKVYEVAEMVGIPDANYFSKCLKKITGMSVKDVKR